MLKKLVFLSLVSILYFNHSIARAKTISPLVYKTIKFTNIDFNDHIEALDYFIGKWKPAKHPTPDAPYDVPTGLTGGGTTDIVYENAKYISKLINASSSPLLAIQKSNNEEEKILDENNAQKLTEALNSFDQAFELIYNYALRIYNIRQSYQDLSDLYATRAKILEGQAKLSEILSRQPQKKD